jgi:Flp pilus assembly protein TadG
MTVGPISCRCGRLRRIADERGSLTIFSLFIIVIMLFAGGMAVDFMRQETARARLQSTLDRAILAAADMDQQLNAESVVRDYFAKSGMSGYTLNVDVRDRDTSRRVAAVTTAPIDSYFLKFLGIDRLDAPAAGAAEESISNIEISLVLDISGSMGETSASGKTKMEELHLAAKAFLTTILAQTDSTRTSISIVPYSTQVNAGAALLSKFNVSNEHDYSNCVDFAPEDYDTASLTTLQPLQRTGHFDPLSGTGTKNASQWICRTDPGVEILPVEQNQLKLEQKIDSLTPRNYTSIEIGMKWGAALLHPDARPAIAALAADDVVEDAVANRPLDINASEALKVIVVMTDGINTNQWFLDPRYRSGPSRVWFDADTGAYSIEGPEAGDRDGDGVAGELYYIPTNSGTNRWKNAPSGSSAVQLTYPELWAKVGMKYNAKTFMQGMTGSSTDYDLWTGGKWIASVWHPGAWSMIGGGEKDIRTDAICTAAKDAGIRIYSIGFEVTNASAAVLQSCASTPSHFFRVDGLSIADAFQSIANDIGKLRLTQ